MSKRFCVLLPLSSEAVRMNCAKHRHLSLREVNEKETSGEIKVLDVHPVTKQARYVVVVAHPTPTALNAGIARLAAGAEFPGATGSERWARNKVEQYSLDPTKRWHSLRNIAWDSADVWYGPTPETGRQRVRVALRLRTPVGTKAATDFYLLRWPDPPHDKLPLSMLGTRMEEFKSALEKLNAHWKEIADGWAAGPWTGILNQLPPGQLPSEILRCVLRTYLHFQKD